MSNKITFGFNELYKVGEVSGALGVILTHNLCTDKNFNTKIALSNLTITESSGAKNNYVVELTVVCLKADNEDKSRVYKVRLTGHIGGGCSGYHSFLSKGQEEPVLASTGAKITMPRGFNEPRYKRKGKAGSGEYEVHLSNGSGKIGIDTVFIGTVKKSFSLVYFRDYWAFTPRPGLASAKPAKDDSYEHCGTDTWDETRYGAIYSFIGGFLTGEVEMLTVDEPTTI